MKNAQKKSNPENNFDLVLDVLEQRAAEQLEKLKEDELIMLVCLCCQRTVFVQYIKECHGGAHIIGVDEEGNEVEGFGMFQFLLQVVQRREENKHLMGFAEIMRQKRS